MSAYKTKTLTVIVPVYNEERCLVQVSENLFATPCPVEREWIFIDDCSTDSSWSLLQKIAQKHPIRIIQQPKNMGKGVAVRRGIQEAQGEWIVIQDADFEYDPNDIPTLLAPLLDGRADVVYGSRFKTGAVQVHRTYHYFVNRLLTILSNLLSGIYVSDMETCYKLFRADLVKAMRLTSRRFGIEIELTAYVAKARTRIYEFPISYYPRTRLQGKKINWKDGVAALFHLVRYNLLTPSSKAFAGLPERYSTGDGK